MTINPNIPIFPQRGYSFSQDFFEGFFHYGKDRYQILDRAILGPDANFRDIPVRHTREAQSLWIIALKIIAIATIILPIVAFIILLDNRDTRSRNHYIINPVPWNPGQPRAPQVAVQPPQRAPAGIFENLMAAVWGPPAAAAPAANQDRIAQVERRYAAYVREVDRVGGALNPVSFKTRLERFRKVEVAFEGGGTPHEIFQRVKKSLGHDAIMFHGEQAADIRGVNWEEREKRFIELVSNEIGLLHKMIHDTSIERVMQACQRQHAAPCIQGTMTALQDLMQEVNGFGLGNQVADPKRNVEDLIPDLKRDQDANQRTSALVNAFLRQQAHAQLQAQGRESTPDARQALTGNERFQKINFTNDAILEWMERNTYVGALTTKFKHNGIPESIYTREIAEENLDIIYKRDLGLDEVELEELPEDPNEVEARERMAANAALAQEDILIAQQLAAQMAQEDAARLAAEAEAEAAVRRLLAEEEAAEQAAANPPGDGVQPPVAIAPVAAAEQLAGVAPDEDVV